MAKKKASGVQAVKPLQKQEDTVKAHQPAMDSDTSEKIDSLKSLNQMLLKEAVERRQQISSLEQSKGYLESEISRSNAERDDLRSELSRLGETLARMELEREVVVDFVAVQAGLKGEDAGRKIDGLEMAMSALRSEIERLNGQLEKAEGVLKNEREVSKEISMEKDGLKNELDLQMEENKSLKEEIDKLGDVKRGLDHRIEELGNAYNALGREGEDLVMRVESIKREKDSVVRGLEEANKLNEDLNEEIRKVVREREVLEKERAAEIVKREGLERDVSGLNETVVSLEKEEEKLRLKVAFLEEQCYESEKRKEELRREIDDLVEEKKLSERKLKGVIGEKIAIEKELGEANKRLGEQKLEIAELGNEKRVILEDKVRLEGDILALKYQVAKLEDAVLTLEEASRVEVGKIKKLENEVREYRCKLDEVKSERSEWENCVQVEKENVVALKGKICGLEDKIRESVEVAEKEKTKNAAILSEKSELESEHGVLKEKIATLESAISEARNELDSIKGRAELADVKSGQAMGILKDAVAFCLKDGDSMEDGDNKNVENEEGKACSTELEMIKRAFKSKESKVEKMNKQLELLQCSVEEAHKKKDFWTMLSSATTLLAAVCIAYIARGH